MTVARGRPHILEQWICDVLHFLMLLAGRTLHVCALVVCFLESLDEHGHSPSLLSSLWRDVVGDCVGTFRCISILCDNTAGNWHTNIHMAGADAEKMAGAAQTVLLHGVLMRSAAGERSAIK